MAPDIVDPSSVFNPGAMRLGHMSYLPAAGADPGPPHLHRAGLPTAWATTRGPAGWPWPRSPVVFDWRGQEPRATIHHIYDARITLLEGRPLVVTAVDLDDVCRLAVWETAGHFDGDYCGLDTLGFLGWSAAPDSRNGVIFPEQVGGRYLMLERPNETGRPNDPASGGQIVLSESDDLRQWRPVGPVMAGRPRYWDELIGAGPPPIKTRQGWLLVYHGVATHFASAHIYQAGAALLDLDDPTRVLARTRDNILEPRLPWELTGQVPNVVFPGGMTVAQLDQQGFAAPEARVLIYYGAADTCVGVAETTVGALVDACRAHP